MKKRILLLFVVLALLLGACTPTPAPAQPPAADGTAFRVGMITDIGGINDQSFNQSAWEGLERARDDFGVSVYVLESRTDADYLAHMETLVEDGVDLVIGVGFRMGDPLQRAAGYWPHVQFAIIDFQYDPADVPNNNITGVMFRANEASFLVGLVAGLTTESNIVGFVNGMDVPIMNEFGVGFYAGVLTVNPDVTIFSQYANAFNDPALGKAIATQMYSDGADVIFHAAGDTGNGVIEAANEMDRWVIGVDMDQLHLAPNNVLTSAMKRVDIATHELVRRLVAGEEMGTGTIIHDLTTGGVGIAPSSYVHVAPDVLTFVEDMKQRIISGEVFVPNTIEEFQTAFPGVSYMGR